MVFFVAFFYLVLHIMISCFAYRDKCSCFIVGTTQIICGFFFVVFVIYSFVPRRADVIVVCCYLYLLVVVCYCCVFIFYLCIFVWSSFGVSGMPLALFPLLVTVVAITVLFWFVCLFVYFFAVLRMFLLLTSLTVSFCCKTFCW